MSSIISEGKNSNSLPDHIFSYNNDEFYNFIKHSYGNDIAELLSFQAIRNGSHLSNTTCDDILLVLQQESDDINQLKNLCCFQVAGNKYEIKLGVKLALNNLIQLLKIKQVQKTKKKRSSAPRPSSSSDTLTSTDQTQPQNETIPPSSTSLTASTSDTSSDTLTSTNKTQPQNETIPPSSTSLTVSTSDTSSTQSRFAPVKNKFNEIDHLLDIEERINKWWSTNNDDNLSLEEGTHYFLAINKSINDKYACVLSCRCGIRFKLPFLAGGFFKLSSFYRHVKEKQCMEVSNTVLATEDNSTNKKSQSNASNRSSKLSNKESNKNKTLTNTTSKRLRSPSKEAPLNISNMANKRSRLSSSNSTNTSPE